MLYGLIAIAAGVLTSAATIMLGYPPVTGALLIALGIGSIVAERMPAQAAQPSPRAGAVRHRCGDGTRATGALFRAALRGARGRLHVQARRRAASRSAALRSIGAAATTPQAVLSD